MTGKIPTTEKRNFRASPPYLFLWFAVLLIALPIIKVDVVSAGLSRWVIGGTRRPWAEWGTLAGIDDVAYPGAIQPKEFRPDENIVLAFDNWYYGGGTLDPDHEEGDPCAWPGAGWGKTYYGYGEDFTDGDPTTAFVFYRTWRWGTPGRMFQLDFGVAVPANRFVFYPVQEGTFEGGPRSDLYMGAYAFSASSEWEDWYDREGDSGFYPSSSENPNWWRFIRHFKDVGVIQEENKDSIVELQFPLQFLRFFRLINYVHKPFEIAELEVYGSGFASEVTYTSNIIDLGELSNLGKLAWGMSTWRRPTPSSDLEPVSESCASVAVRVRSGKDDTPLVYHKWTKRCEEEVVDKETWESLPEIPSGEPIRPEYQASVTYDVEHWTGWSLPYTAPGQPFGAPGPRRYVQFQITLSTEAPEEMVRVDSLWVEVSQPPLVEALVGEVAVSGMPTPPEGAAVVDAGVPTTFTYDVKATFASPEQSGFDSLRVDVPSQARFESLEIGKGDTLIPLARKDALWGDSIYRDLLTGDSVFVDVGQPDRLVAYFPSTPVVYGGWDRLRLTFTTSVLVYGTRFMGTVWRSGTGELPGSIESGDAHPEVSTDKLSVLIREGHLKAVLDSIWVVPPGISPNGDGMHDAAAICYRLLKLTGEAEVHVEIYDLTGRKVRTVFRGRQKSGVYEHPGGIYRHRVWDGRSEEGSPVPPGIYLYRVSVHTDVERTEKSGTIVVVY